MPLASQSPPVPQPYDRNGLEQLLNRYLDALAAGDPGAVPFASDARFAENDQRLALGEASWRTIDSIGAYCHIFCDPERGEVGAIANVTENGTGAILIVRLKLADGRIAEVEQFVVRDPDGARRYQEMGEPDPVWQEPIPPALRQTHEALEAASWMYFQTLERNDGAGIYPFAENCERLEHARPAANTKTNEEYGHAETSVEFTTLKVREQYSLGMMGFISRIRDRRALVIDVERGAVLGTSIFDFDGMLETIHFADGSKFPIPKYFRTPRSHHMNEAFKVLNSTFRYVEMTLLEVPHGTLPAWRKQPTTRMDYAPLAPLRPAVRKDRESLLALVECVMEALVQSCPCELPLTEDAVYVENGVDVAFGEGLWKSVWQRGNFRIPLADPESGQAGYYGDVDEHGNFAMVALRLKLRDGRICEIETTIARPEKRADPTQLGEATSSMFIPPLLLELEPAGFAAPDPVLLKAPIRATPRRDMLKAVERYFEGFAKRSPSTISFAQDCARRENGHMASGNADGPVVDPDHAGFELFAGSCSEQIGTGYLAALGSIRRRPLVVDTKAGLVMDRALFDGRGEAKPVRVAGVGGIAVPEPFRAPMTDIHAQLFKIDGGRIAAIEGIVRRVPYGQTSRWDRPLET